METRLNVMGVQVLIESGREIAFWLRNDYGRYISKDAVRPRLKFELALEKPDYAGLPKMAASKYHEDYIVYDSRGLRLIDFFGEALSAYDTEKRSVLISCLCAQRLYEIFRLSFDSLLGEELDRRGIHRIHCLGLEKGGAAVLVLLPPGCGKSSLALRFLGAEGIKVLSEDVALFDRGRIVGLHFHWGIRKGAGRLPGRMVRRKGLPDKNFVDARTLSLASDGRPKALILGRKVMGGESAISPVGRHRLILPLFKSMVLGLELQQSLAYFLLRNYKDGFSKSGIGLSRLYALLSVLLHSTTYEFAVGGDMEENHRVLAEFMDRL